MTVKNTEGTPGPTLADTFARAAPIRGSSGSPSQSRHSQGSANKPGTAAPATQQRPVAEQQPAQQTAATAAPNKPTNTEQVAQPKENTMSQDNYADSRRNSQDGDRHYLSDQGSMHARPMSRFFGDGRVTQIGIELNKIAKERIRAQRTSKFHVLTLSSAETGLPLSVILVIQTATVSNNQHGSIFSVFIESEDLRLPTIAEKNENGAPIEVPATLGDVLNSKEYWNIVTGHATSALGESIWYEAGAERIPAAKQENEEYFLTALLFQATRATFSNLNEHVTISDERPFNIAKRNSSETLTARLNTSAEQGQNISGEPVRQDVVVEMFSGKASDNFITSERMITQVTGYIDSVYAQPVQPIPGQVAENQPLFPMFVITGLETGYDALDREMVGLALATSTLLEPNDAWAGQFRPRRAGRQQTTTRGKGGEEDIDLRDSGAFAYLYNTDGKRLNTRSEDFLSAFGDHMRQTFRPRLIYAIDIPELGGNSWAFDVYRAAANGNAKAAAAIIKSYDNLTGNRFSPIFERMGGGKLIESLGVRVANGFYLRENGERRDLRDVDQLAVLNTFGKNSPKTVLEYADSFSPLKGRPNQRLHTRLTIIDEVVSSRMTITGMSDRYVFPQNAMRALAQACSEAGLSVQPGNITSAGLGGGSIMGGFDFSAYASTGGNGSDLYTSRVNTSQQQPAGRNWG